MKSSDEKYDYYCSILKNEQKPLAFIDLNILDENIQSVLYRLGPNQKIRLASKSIRCLYLLKYILNSSPQFCGVMTYDAKETLFLSQNGIDNILIGYPLCDTKLIEPIMKEIIQGKRICFMCDREEHIYIIEELAKQYNVKVSICIDLDMSQTFPFIYFGVNRSAIKTPQSLLNILSCIKKCHYISLKGIMGYEAQIAGVSDNSSQNKLRNIVIRFLKKLSIKTISHKRKKYFDLITENGFKLEFVNGGGTGSIESTKNDDSVTEIAVGSAFYSPHLFDDYKLFKHSPAAGFALEITRNPKQHIFTAHGGGYQASGSVEHNKTPKPYLPDKLFLLPHESAGEVQTPLLYKGNRELKIGDMVLLRHAKSGELCERFNDLHLIKKSSILGLVKTYRGEGICTI